MALSTIILGCDLSEGSDQALGRAIAIAKQHGARLILCHAQADDAPIKDVDNAILSQLGEVSAAIRAAEAIQIADRMEQVRAAGLHADVISRVGPPGEVIANAANDAEADLIVVGTHGRTGLSRFLIGSVAADTIRLAVCDVLVCRGPAATTMFAKPLVATDFSPTASRALDHVTHVCAPGSHIDVVHAWQLPAGSWGATLLGQARFPWSSVRDAVLSGVKSQTDALQKQQAAAGRTISVELVQGQPVSVVTQLAERAGNDVIAVGAHGHRGVRRLLLGSVAESTIRHSPCSVLVVHDATAELKK